MELWPSARESLWALMEASPHKIEELAQVLEFGGIDGQEEDALLRYFEDPSLEEDLHIIASGTTNSLMNLPPIEAFILDVEPTDTLESCEELRMISDTLREFTKQQERRFQTLIDGEEFNY